MRCKTRQYDIRCELVIEIKLNKKVLYYKWPHKYLSCELKNIVNNSTKFFANLFQFWPEHTAVPLPQIFRRPIYILYIYIYHGICKKSFTLFCVASYFWNYLPNEITDATSLDLFQRKFYYKLLNCANCREY